MGYGAPPDESGSNPIVEVNLRATEGDNFYFRADKHMNLHLSS